MIKKAYSTIIFLILINSWGSVAQTADSADFDKQFRSFWSSTISELNEIPFSVKKLKSQIHKNKSITLYELNSYANIKIHIYVSEPIKKGKYETRIMFWPFGERDYSFDWFLKDEFMQQHNIINVRVDNRGQGLSREVVSNEKFILNGIGKKETYVYRGVFMDVVRAVDFISEHKKSNGVIVVFGKSQGGMLALVASALNPKVDIAIVRIPFFAGLEYYDKDRWPMDWILSTSNYQRGITQKEQLNILAYYDVKNFAKLLKIPVYIGVGENDPITSYRAILEAFSNIKNSNKIIYVVSPCDTHGFKSNSEEKISALFLKNELKKIYKDKGIE